MQQWKREEKTNRRPEIAVVGEGDRQLRRFMNAGRSEESLVVRKSAKTKLK